MGIVGGVVVVVVVLIDVVVVDCRVVVVVDDCEVVDDVDVVLAVVAVVPVVDELEPSAVEVVPAVEVVVWSLSWPGRGGPFPSGPFPFPFPGLVFCEDTTPSTRTRRFLSPPSGLSLAADSSSTETSVATDLISTLSSPRESVQAVAMTASVAMVNKAGIVKPDPHVRSIP